MTRRALRVAIVGLGPKGLFAFERLVHHASRRRVALDVDVYEPHQNPGAGAVYDPSQPPYLRMNLSADHLNLWSGENAAVPSGERLTFDGWRRIRGGPVEHGEQERYPPRSLVGEYLADGLALLRRDLPADLRLRVVAQEVCAVERAGRRWALTAADGSVSAYEQVLLTIGHGPTVAASPVGPWTHAAPLVPAVFPVGDALTGDGIAAGATVAVRGFALTFLDAALAMTEGRGGRFETGTGPADLRYVPGNDEVDVLLPFSRTGRPLLAKPDPALARSLPDLAGIAARGAERLATLPPRFRLRGDLLPVLTATAAACLRAADRRHDAGDASIAAWLTDACDGTPPAPGWGPAEEIRRSLEVGSGRRTPDLPWALGHAWQALYPSLVGRLSGSSGLAPGDWPDILRLSAEMERLAFGPPPVNAAKLLALVDAGRVDLSWTRGARLVTDGGVTSLTCGGRRRPVDVVVNAVLGAPGAPGPRPALVAGLVDRGAARTAAFRRGLEVTGDGTCVARDGGRSEGLAAIGRLTEDSVVGNDTLNRALHGHADRWARRVVDTAAAELARVA